MKEDRVNRWLTLGANVGVLIGISLLLVELDQNATVMKAQISSERADQAIGVLMTVAQSRELSDIEAMLLSSGFPDSASAIAELEPGQVRQYYAYLMAERFRIENVLYQQTLGVLIDSDYLASAQELLPKLKAMGVSGGGERLEQLVAQVEAMSPPSSKR
jgi:hypothetical protein